MSGVLVTTIGDEEIPVHSVLIVRTSESPNLLSSVIPRTMAMTVSLHSGFMCLKWHDHESLPCHSLLIKVGRSCPLARE